MSHEEPAADASSSVLAESIDVPVTDSLAAAASQEKSSRDGEDDKGPSK